MSCSARARTGKAGIGSSWAWTAEGEGELGTSWGRVSWMSEFVHHVSTPPPDPRRADKRRRLIGSRASFALVVASAVAGV